MVRRTHRIDVRGLKHGGCIEYELKVRPAVGIHCYINSPSRFLICLAELSRQAELGIGGPGALNILQYYLLSRYLPT